MARLVVVDEAEGAKFPFLRGILTRSLQEAGLPIDEAYQLASEIRDKFDGDGEVTTQALRRHVLKRLEKYGKDAVQRYESSAKLDLIQMRFSDGHERPYSRGRQRIRLVSCGLTPEQATEATLRIHNELMSRSVRMFSSSDIRQLTHQDLLTHLGKDAARRYVVWEEFQHSDRPLIVVIGGCVGSGKSTISAAIGHYLDIVRTQSTDMLREVMRMMVAERLLPMLHKSTFTAWKGLPGRANDGNGSEPSNADLVAGYLTQSRYVSVACEAVIQRAVRERVSLILEGVHAHPGLIADFPEASEAIIVRVMLAVTKARELKSRIKGRGQLAPARRAKRYLEHFDSIWDLQSFMLSEADQLGVPIVTNTDVDSATHQVTGIVMDALAKEFKGTPEEVL